MAAQAGKNGSHDHSALISKRAGLGQISEIFDAEEPHNPRGCIAQAWSVAELLRLAKLVGEKSLETTTPQVERESVAVD